MSATIASEAVRWWSAGRRSEAMVVVAAVAIGLTACPAKPGGDPLVPEKVYTPTVIGVVERAERLGNNVVLVTLDDERDLRIDLGNATAVANYPDPAPDYLLFYGEDADGPWYLAIAGSPACYQIAARAIDHGAFLVFNFGLRVPKADDFDPGSVTGRRFDNPQAGFCLNADGEATEYLS